MLKHRFGSNMNGTNRLRPRFRGSPVKETTHPKPAKYYLLSTKLQIKSWLSHPYVRTSLYLLVILSTIAIFVDIVTMRRYVMLTAYWKYKASEEEIHDARYYGYGAVRMSYVRDMSPLLLHLADPCEYRLTDELAGGTSGEAMFVSTRKHVKDYQRIHAGDSDICPFNKGKFKVDAAGSGDRDKVAQMRRNAIDEFVGSNKKKGFTVMVNTFRRPSCLLGQLKALVHCKENGVTDGMKQIRVAWPDPANKPSAKVMRFVKRKAKTIEILFDRFNDTYISKRYCPGCEFKTDAIFTVDDDVRFDCMLIAQLFEHWSYYPMHMLAEHAVYLSPHSPRDTDIDSQSDGQMNNNNEIIREWQPPPAATAGGSDGQVGVDVNVGDVLRWQQDKARLYRWEQPYNRPLKISWEESVYNAEWITKGGMIHRQYYEAYWKQRYYVVRKLVDEYITGEDMLMAVVYFNENKGKLPFLWFAERYRDVPMVPLPSVHYWDRREVKCHTKANNLQVRTGKKRKLIWDKIDGELGQRAWLTDYVALDDCRNFQEEQKKFHLCT